MKHVSILLARLHMYITSRKTLHGVELTSAGKTAGVAALRAVCSGALPRVNIYRYVLKHASCVAVTKLKLALANAHLCATIYPFPHLCRHTAM